MQGQTSRKTQGSSSTKPSLQSRPPCRHPLIRLQQVQQISAAQALPMHSKQTRSVRVTAQGSNSSSNSHAGHAFLHDFCMTIPYGGLAALSGLLAFVFKAPAVGLQLAAVAAVVAVCSILSLKSWKAGGSSAAYTLVSAGASGWVAHQMWQRVTSSIAPVPSGIMLAVSAALCAFCVYNVLAGGNPPPAKKAA